MKNKKTTVLLIILALLGLFTGMNINKNLNFLYQYTLIDGPRMTYTDILKGTVDWVMTIHWIASTFTQLGLVTLPFIYMKKWGKKLVFYVPLLFLICQFFLLAIFIFILIPFVILWLAILFMMKKESMVVAHL
jgi:hypothetical protein